MKQMIQNWFGNLQNIYIDFKKLYEDGYIEKINEYPLV